MRFPWVPRSTLEAVEAERDELRVLLNKGFDRERDLIDRLTTMQRQGFRAVPPVADVKQPAPLPAGVQTALDALPKALRREQHTLAVQWLAEGEEPTTVAMRLLNGAEGA